MTWKNSP